MLTYVLIAAALCLMVGITLYPIAAAANARDDLESMAPPPTIRTSPANQADS